MRDSTCSPVSSAQRTRLVRHLSIGSCLIFGAACTDATTTAPRTVAVATPPLTRIDAMATADITGSWAYHEEATFLLRDFAGDDRAGVKAFRCVSDGVYTFVQTGTDFTGTYDQTGSCSATDGTTFPNNFTGVSVTGSVQARHLDFVTADGCRYDAALRGATLSAMGGSGICGAIKYGGTYRATFSAVR